MRAAAAGAAGARRERRGARRPRVGTTAPERENTMRKRRAIKGVKQRVFSQAVGGAFDSTFYVQQLRARLYIQRLGLARRLALDIFSIFLHQLAGRVRPVEPLTGPVDHPRGARRAGGSIIRPRPDESMVRRGGPRPDESSVDRSTARVLPDASMDGALRRWKSRVNEEGDDLPDRGARRSIGTVHERRRREAAVGATLGQVQADFGCGCDGGHVYGRHVPAHRLLAEGLP